MVRSEELDRGIRSLVPQQRFDAREGHICTNIVCVKCSIQMCVYEFKCGKVPKGRQLLGSSGVERVGRVVYIEDAVSTREKRERVLERERRERVVGE